MLRIIGDGEHAAVVKDVLRGAYWHSGAFIAVGDPKVRRSIAGERSEIWRTVIDASATVSPLAHLCDGVFVGPGAIINCGVVIGDHTIVNTGAIVEHDVCVGAFVNVNPGAVIGGGARIGSGTVLGLGCRVRDHITIGSDVTVGMGAVVVEDVPDGVTVMGCPARIVKRA